MMEKNGYMDMIYDGGNLSTLRKPLPNPKSHAIFQHIVLINELYLENNFISIENCDQENCLYCFHFGFIELLLLFICWFLLFLLLLPPNNIMTLHCAMASLLLRNIDAGLKYRTVRETSSPAFLRTVTAFSWVLFSIETSFT